MIREKVGGAKLNGKINYEWRNREGSNSCRKFSKSDSKSIPNLISTSLAYLLDSYRKT